MNTGSTDVEEFNRFIENMTLMDILVAVQNSHGVWK